MAGKPIRAIRADGWIKEYQTMRLAQRELKISFKTVRMCLTDKGMAWKGYSFEYIPKVERVKAEPPARKIPERTEEERQALRDIIFRKDGAKEYYRLKRAASVTKPE
jgi:hypothetical protein